MTRGLQRVKWQEFVGAEGQVAALEQGAGYPAYWQLDGAMAKLCPNSLVLHESEDIGKSQVSLEVRPGKKPPQFGVALELCWQPPVWHGRLIRRGFVAILKPELAEGQEEHSWRREREIVRWAVEERTRLAPVRLLTWRPKTSLVKQLGGEVGVRNVLPTSTSPEPSL